ncbi:hypothetical protein [Pedobacter xixiisoli]|uniref:LytTr DNA-binding domain-containing protein n=1 Tax=Pedobacter xixiisoli TaxID=1476464 RepID=A0A285ZW83_9SPHI|nr:hypothetical protein [Pedobacter xixiisoli]SOD13902.1 hypothetical protein SAMN06297358_1300 [Pedobacter xixiisoli]
MLKRILKHICTKFFLINLLLITIISLLAGHFIVTHGRKETLAQLWKMPAYYRSVGYSATIALFLQLAVYAVSYKLSRKHRGKGLTKKWAMDQFTYGFVVVIVLELLLAAALFGMHGLWLPETAFFRKLFGPIVLFILIINLCYVIYYMNKNPVVKHTVKRLIPKKVEPRMIVVSEPELPALVYATEAGVLAYDFLGKQMVWMEPVKTSIERLGDEDYYSGQRHWVIHRLAIADLENISGKRILLKLHFDFEYEMIVSRRRSPEFRKWFDEEKEELNG